MDSNYASIMRCISENIKGKFSLLASCLPGMYVEDLGSIQYIACSKQSDAFNTVFGIPSGVHDIEAITDYYQQKKMPAAW